MSRLLLLSLSLLAFCISGLAQQSDSSQTSTSKKTAEQTMTGSRSVPSSSKQTQHITGCLEKQNGQYVLKEKDGKVANVTSTLDLASQVGHEVTATGTWHPRSNAETPNENPKGEVVDNPNQLLEIGHLKIRSNNCK
ncbi:MAG TPA: hypothetical protein VJN48_17565 [Terriglobales bacterium]|nr:hypothetical protein [Terriglobales bacterium]